MTEPDKALVVYEPQPIVIDVDEPFEVDDDPALAVIVTASINLLDEAITFTVEDVP